MSVISIALVDDHRVIARSLQAYLESFPDMKIAGIAASGEDGCANVALGRSNKDIARALGIGDETVKTHVANLLSKLQVENRAQAIVLSLKRGLVSLEDLQQ